MPAAAPRCRQRHYGAIALILHAPPDAAAIFRLRHFIDARALMI